MTHTKITVSWPTITQLSRVTVHFPPPEGQSGRAAGNKELRTHRDGGQPTFSNLGNLVGARLQFLLSIECVVQGLSMRGRRPPSEIGVRQAFLGLLVAATTRFCIAGPICSGQFIS
jgi:hypothetical protein